MSNRRDVTVSTIGVPAGTYESWIDWGILSTDVANRRTTIAIWWDIRTNNGAYSFWVNNVNVNMNIWADGVGDPHPINVIRNVSVNGSTPQVQLMYTTVTVQHKSDGTGALGVCVTMNTGITGNGAVTSVNGCGDWTLPTIAVNPTVRITSYSQVDARSLRWNFDVPFVVGGLDRYVARLLKNGVVVMNWTNFYNNTLPYTWTDPTGTLTNGANYQLELYGVDDAGRVSSTVTQTIQPRVTLMTFATTTFAQGSYNSLNFGATVNVGTTPFSHFIYEIRQGTTSVVHTLQTTATSGVYQKLPWLVAGQYMIIIKAYDTQGRFITYSTSMTTSVTFNSLTTLTASQPNYRTIRLTMVRATTGNVPFGWYVIDMVKGGVTTRLVTRQTSNTFDFINGTSLDMGVAYTFIVYNYSSSGDLVNSKQVVFIPTTPTNIISIYPTLSFDTLSTLNWSYNATGSTVEITSVKVEIFEGSNLNRLIQTSTFIDRGYSVSRTGNIALATLNSLLTTPLKEGDAISMRVTATDFFNRTGSQQLHTIVGYPSNFNWTSDWNVFTQVNQNFLQYQISTNTLTHGSITTMDITIKDTLTNEVIFTESVPYSTVIRTARRYDFIFGRQYTITAVLNHSFGRTRTINAGITMATPNYILPRMNLKKIVTGSETFTQVRPWVKTLQSNQGTYIQSNIAWVKTLDGWKKLQ